MKAIMAGMTDYSQQNLEDIKSDLENELKEVKRDLLTINNDFEDLVKSGYWKSQVSSDFRNCTGYFLKFSETLVVELKVIIENLKKGVTKESINRLAAIVETAKKIEDKFGDVWNNFYPFKDYGNKDFKKVEQIYGRGRDLVINLSDISNMVSRLRVFESPYALRGGDSPWKSGGFYVVTALLFMILLIVGMQYLSFLEIFLVTISVALLLMTVGLLQLRFDNKISDKSFSHLFSLLIKKLPMFSKIIKTED